MNEIKITTERFSGKLDQVEDSVNLIQAFCNSPRKEKNDEKNEENLQGL
jgi:hypothetical protein